tara:strand:- start:355 stop:561 length:207 start_codon:yes stop_codon:yes gene_type:complete
MLYHQTPVGNLYPVNISYADMIASYMARNDNKVTLGEISASGSVTTLTHSNFSDNSQIGIVATYITAS